MRNSKVIDIVRELRHWGLRVKAMDPWANAHEVQQEYGLKFTTITRHTPVDSLIIAVAHQEFASLTPAHLRALCAPIVNPVIRDLKALYDRRGSRCFGFRMGDEEQQIVGSASRCASDKETNHC